MSNSAATFTVYSLTDDLKKPVVLDQFGEKVPSKLVSKTLIVAKFNDGELFDHEPYDEGKHQCLNYTGYLKFGNSEYRIINECIYSFEASELWCKYYDFNAKPGVRYYEPVVDETCTGTNSRLQIDKMVDKLCEVNRFEDLPKDFIKIDDVHIFVTMKYFDKVKNIIDTYHRYLSSTRFTFFFESDGEYVNLDKLEELGIDYSVVIPSKSNLHASKPCERLISLNAGSSKVHKISNTILSSARCLECTTGQVLVMIDCAKNTDFRLGVEELCIVNFGDDTGDSIKVSDILLLCPRLETLDMDIEIEFDIETPNLNIDSSEGYSKCIMSANKLSICGDIAIDWYGTVLVSEKINRIRYESPIPGFESRYYLELVNPRNAKSARTVV